MTDYTVGIIQKEIVGRAFVVSVLRQTAPYLVFTVLADEQPNLKAI